MSLTHIGRRKCAIALVRFSKGSGDFIINGKKGFSYLQEDPFAIQTVIAPLKLINLEKKYNIICSVRGGGVCAQAEAIQLGVARGLCFLKAQDSSTSPSTISKNSLDSLDSFSLGSTSKIQDQFITSEERTDKETKDKITIPPNNFGNFDKLEGFTKKGVRSLLKEQGLLRRDSRIKERRKYGLKKARKAEQYSKR